MKNVFAESVYNYFQNKINKTNKPLNKVEQSIFSESVKQMNRFPISVLTEDNLVKLGFKMEECDRKKLSHLADRLGESYQEQMYWDSLDELAQELGFEKANNCETMMNDYFNLLKEGKFVKSAIVVVKYKNAKLPVTATIALEDEAVADKNCILKVNSIMDLSTYFDENNPNDFYIKQYVEFNFDD